MFPKMILMRSCSTGYVLKITPKHFFLAQDVA